MLQWSKHNPRLQRFVAKTREHVPDDRNGQQGCCHSIESYPKGNQETATRDRCGGCLVWLGSLHGHGVYAFLLLHNPGSLTALARARGPTWDTLTV